MAILIKEQESCAAAWLTAVEAVDGEPRHEAHNVMIEIADPLHWSEQDQRLVEAVDVFLRHHNGWPVPTVANTIFPESLYRRYGADGLYAGYCRILPKMSRGTNN